MTMLHRTLLPALALAGAEFAGDEDNLFGYDDLGDDDFGDDDLLGEDDFGDDDIGDDDEVGDDDDDDVGDDEVGASGRRRSRRQARRARRRSRKSGSGTSSRRKKKVQWAKTILAKKQAPGSTSASVEFRLQHDFIAQDLTLSGSTSGAVVTTVMFGDKVVFSNPDGVPAEVLGTSSFIRDLVKGQKLRAGLDIIVSGSVASPNDTFRVTITGFKPDGRRNC